MKIFEDACRCKFGSMPWFSLQISALLITVFSTRLLWWFAAIRSEDGASISHFMCALPYSLRIICSFSDRIVQIFIFLTPSQPFFVEFRLACVNDESSQSWFGHVIKYVEKACCAVYYMSLYSISCSLR